ncbi:MAG: capsular polysaccharide synthesis protein [Treponema sp.]|nr:capsular polysaccharide synthesis protein [Treponema sp.]
MKLTKHIKRFFPQCRLYGFSVAFWALAYPFYRLFGPLKPYFAVHKHRAILKYLTRKYSGIVNQFTDSDKTPESPIGPESTIWVSWWDGEEVMPALVKVCCQTIKQHAGTHPVVLITKDNYCDYVSIPDYIMDRVNAGNMKITHFSNILRANLLYKYGGIWLDATILSLKNISLENSFFFTLKAPAKKSVSVTLTRFAGLSNNARKLHNQAYPQISRWSGFLLAGTKGSPVFKYMMDILYAYWKDHTDQIDYVLFDYTIAFGYDNIPVIKNLVDNVPCSDTEKFELEKDLNSEYSEERFAKYCSAAFHKLTWKKKFYTHTKEGKLTIYGHILDTFAGNTA